MAESDRARELAEKAAGKMGEMASQAMAAAARQRRIDAERRVLADLRAEALRLRAQIGEEMFKLWQARSLPPSSLDHLFEAVDRAMIEIAEHNEHIERLLAPPPQTVPATYTLSEAPDEEDPPEAPLPPPPVPAAHTHLLTESEQPCPTCGAANPVGHRFCMDCGARLN